MQDKVFFITGGARRIGAAIVRELHACGGNIVLHYRGSEDAARALADRLNKLRPSSVKLLQADLLAIDSLPDVITQAARCWGRLDGLVNNASSFFPTPIGKITLSAWNDLVGSNLQAPLFMAQAAAPWLTETRGAIVNIADIHAERPMKAHTVYSIAKAGVVAMTASLAVELAPRVRVNAVAPGVNLWPAEFSETLREQILETVPLGRPGTPEELAEVVRFLLAEASYITGQVINVDGGRSIVLP
jgi:pteridine reductase